MEGYVHTLFHHEPVNIAKWMGACFFTSISLSFFVKQIVLSFDLVLLDENAKAWHCQNIKQCRRVKGKKQKNF